MSRAMRLQHRRSFLCQAQRYAQKSRREMFGSLSLLHVNEYK